MSSYLSASSRSTNRRPVTGVPLRCWCGSKIVTYASQTKENLFRRFYRCEVALQRKMEDHLFKWIDEALLDETKMLEAKHMQLVEEVKALKREMVKNLELQNNMLYKMEKEIKEKVDEKMKDVIMIANASMHKIDGELAKKCMQKVGITILVVGTIRWICGKFL